MRGRPLAKVKRGCCAGAEVGAPPARYRPIVAYGQSGPPTRGICSVAKCPRGVGEKLEVWCCHTVRVDEVGRTIPCGQEVGPPRNVRLCLDAQAEPVVEVPDGRVEGN